MATKNSVLPIIPNWVPGGDPSGLPPPGTESEAAKPERSQVMVAGKDSVIPVVYGGPERRGGLIYWAGVESTPFPDGLLVVIIFCEGPVESIGSVYINDVAAPSPFSPYQYTLYDGTQTTADAVAAYNIPGWTETLEGYCYGVFHFAPGYYHNFPRVTVEIEGKLLYDPRTTITAWSNNPALIIRDFIVNQAGKSVDDTSVIAAANACDVLVGTSPNFETFSSLTISLAEKKSTAEWLEILRAHLPGWVVDHGSSMSITVDASGHSVSHTFDSSNIDTDPPPRLFKRGSSDRPDIVEVGYTDTTTTPWSTRYASAGSGTSKTRIELPGIRTYSQAKRFATTRLNHYTLEGLEGEIGVFDYGLKVMPGDLAQITESAFGWTNKQVRVLQATDRGHGRWTVRFRIYDPAAYSDTVVTAPTWPQTDLPNPDDVPAPTNVVADYVWETTSTGQVLKITATWDATTWPFFAQYKVSLYKGADLLEVAFTDSPSFKSQPVGVIGATYTVGVSIVSIFKKTGIGLADDILTGYYGTTETAAKTAIHTIVKVADGSAAAPSMTFSSTGNDDAGLYLPANNTVGIVTAGTERVRIDSSGNVGIGTSPSYKLHVSAGDMAISGQAQANIHFRSQTNTNGFIVGRSLSADNANDFFIYDATNSAARFQISPSGNVGIGTSPSYRLHVKQSGNTSAGSLGVISVNSADDSFVGIGYDNASGSMRLFSSYETTGAYKPLTFWTADAERVRIDTSGNFGIGTSSPRAKLDVLSGTANINGDTANGINVTAANTTITSNNANFSINTNDVQAVDVGGSIGLGGLYRTNVRDNVAYAIIKGAKENSTDQNYAGYLAFATRPHGGSNTERLRITSDGRLYGTALHNNSGGAGGGDSAKQHIASGDTTPTPSNASNATNITGRLWTWSRVGNVVHFSGVFDSGASVANTITTVKVTPYIASAFTTAYQCTGTVAYWTGSGYATGEVYASSSDDTIAISWYPAATSIREIRVTGSYIVL